MQDENSLVRFLYDYPWTSSSILESVFGPHFAKLAKAKETRTVQVPEIGKCWGVKQEKISSLPGVRRRKLAKKYLSDHYGPDAFWTGGSPGLWGSDLLALIGHQRKYWIRIWVDNEGPGVEALPFVNPVPARFAPNLVDLILTLSSGRAELIKRQIASRWPKRKRPALIYYCSEGGYLNHGKYPSSFGNNPNGRPLEIQEVTKLLAAQRWERLKNLRHEQVAGSLFLTLQGVDLDLLKYVGDNPLFDIDGLATLVSSSVTGIDLAMVKEKARHRFVCLEELGLIENTVPPLIGKKVSSLGMRVLSKYWGLSPDNMRIFQAWPQKKNTDGILEYSENALSFTKVHTREVQHFVFGLLDNAWRLHQEYGGVDVYLETIIGKRIYFQDLSSGGFDWVIPDAAIDLSFWRRTWRDGHVYDPKIVFSAAQLLVEIDRATNPITRLAARIKKYGRIWHSLSVNPVQVWVIDGSPWREKEILEMLGEAGINGWTVLNERLVLGKDDPWWERFSHKEGVLPFNKHHGCAPLRKIWRRVGDYELHHLMDHAPWEKEMSQSKPPVKVLRGY